VLYPNPLKNGFVCFFSSPIAGLCPDTPQCFFGKSIDEKAIGDRTWNALQINIASTDMTVAVIPH